MISLMSTFFINFVLFRIFPFVLMSANFNLSDATNALEQVDKCTPPLANQLY